MHFTTRRTALLALPFLAACASSAVSAPPPPQGIDPYSPKDAGLGDWLVGFRERALAKGIPEATLSRALDPIGLNRSVLDRQANQAEFTKTLAEYLDIVAAPAKVAIGRAAVAAHGKTLAAVASTYGVDQKIIAAIWGVESVYGTRRGTTRVIEALATLAYAGRRADFFEGQLVAALKILAAGDVPVERMTGSWAGAMGHTQFIPTSYLAYAADFTGDGRRDIWADDPADALASTANYLARSGFVSGLPVLGEAQVPADLSQTLVGKGKGRAMEDWRALGVSEAGSRKLPDGPAFSLIEPEGRSGRAFLISANFRSILRYNNADFYAIGVALLADQLA